MLYKSDLREVELITPKGYFIATACRAYSAVQSSP
jgi:hypothetical protein